MSEQEVDVNRGRLDSKGKQISGKPGQQWGGLAKDRPVVLAGRPMQSAGRAQDRSRIYQEEALRKLKAFLHRNRDWDPSSQ